MNPEIQTLDSTVVYENKWMTVREDKIRRADGSDGIYGVVDKPDFAVIAAVSANQIYLVEQFRYPVRARLWELPQGSWNNKDINPMELARAELREETGLIADSIVHVGRMHVAYGHSSQAFNLFLATGLVQGPTDLDPEEIGLVSRAFPIPTVQDMICQGVITDATSVASLGLLRLRGLV